MLASLAETQTWVHGLEERERGGRVGKTEEKEKQRQLGNGRERNMGDGKSSRKQFRGRAETDGEGEGQTGQGGENGGADRIGRGVGRCRAGQGGEGDVNTQMYGKRSQCTLHPPSILLLNPPSHCPPTGIIYAACPSL